MEIGGYEAWLIDDSGKVAERLGSRIARTSSPAVGEALEHEGRCYRVRDVWHFDEKTKRQVTKKHSYPVVLVQRIEESAPVPPDDKDRSVPSIGSRSARGTILNLVPREIPPETRAADAIPRQLLALIAVLVACGYRAHADRLNAARRFAHDLKWGGKPWLLDHLSHGGASEHELHQLSREAVREFREAMSLVHQLSAQSPSIAQVAA